MGEGLGLPLWRPTFAEVDISALRSNIAYIKEQIGGDCVLMAVVKADGYGHGLVRIAKEALRCGAGILCVAVPEEGALLRQSGITQPILVLGGANEEGLLASAELGLIQTVFYAGDIYKINEIAGRLGKLARIDIKIDTGMNRIGAKSREEIAQIMRALSECESLAVHGIFTHFPSAEDDRDYTLGQLDRFWSLAKPVKAAYPAAMLHCANSAAALFYPQTRLDGVRCGLAMYGSGPAPEGFSGLKPLMSWKTHIAWVKTIEPGETVSYGRKFTAEKRMRVATLPVGYGDGYMRCLGGVAHVLIRGQKAPVIGRVCMDQLMADVTGLGAERGDEAVLLGRQGDEEITPWQMALWAGTLPYEITLSVSGRVPRIYVNE